MDYEFSSKEELFIRVKPALYAKKKELIRLGYLGISEVDIWNYLIEFKWIKSFNLTLFDIVNDILKLDNNKIYNFVRNKEVFRQSQYFDNNIDVL